MTLLFFGCSEHQTKNKFNPMGLDAVEIVMEVEETFDITIEDSEAERLVTPGQLIDLVLSKVGRTTHAACLTQRAFHRLRASLMRQLGCKRNQVKLDTLLSSAFSRPTRKEQLRRVLMDVGVQHDLVLVRPTWLSNSIVAVTFSGGFMTCIFLAWRPLASPNLFLNLLFGSPIVAGTLFCLVFGWLACYATRWTRIEFSPAMKSVSQLSRWIVAKAPDVVKAPLGQWSREQVSETVRLIVIEILCCEKDYREDAKFVKDLGLS